MATLRGDEGTLWDGRDGVDDSGLLRVVIGRPGTGPIRRALGGEVTVPQAENPCVHRLPETLSRSRTPAWERTICEARAPRACRSESFGGLGS